MSNRIASQHCEDIILALEDCQRKHSFFEKATGACFDLEKAMRICRHEARLEDRRKHVDAAQEKRRAQRERWEKIDNDDE